ncbi:hypothetical protein QJS04_geneDACA012775 [Acorus gramineus]|uniref:Longin domain-containing protein n=1 Tax=Acorus gramineus TaxID=55184 RepID=A0AAV9BIG0_ACOGR|nr:hypothetical protein QJS04_geneDACA012775 [Acorus gramineus]
MLPPRRSPILYACVSTGSTVLADATIGSGGDDEDLEAIAAKCLENAPPHHLRYSHTVRGRVYSFLMDGGPFVFFSISEDGRGPPFRFLRRVRDAFAASIGSPGRRRIFRRCFQERFGPVIRRLAEADEKAGVEIECAAEAKGEEEERRRREAWRRHVRVILAADLVVCLVLFAIWMSICGGLRCIP